jgi:hypothetical protein
LAFVAVNTLAPIMACLLLAFQIARSCGTKLSRNLRALF